MRALLLLLVAVFSQVAADINFVAKGSWTGISADDLAGINQWSLEAKMDAASKSLTNLLGSTFVGFQIEEYLVHGEATAVFKAVLTVTDEASRDTVVSRLEGSDFDLYHLQKTAVKVNLARRWTPKARDVQTNCFNGGVLLPNGTCACNQYTRGDDCSFFVCKNGGIYDQGRCVCPPGLYSLHCEQRGCVPQVESAVDFSSESLLISINLKTSMGLDLQSIIDGLPLLMSDFDKAKVAPFKNFIITVYRLSASGNYFLETQLFNTMSDVIDYLYNCVIGAGAADQPHLDAIVATQRYTGYMKPESTYFAFIDSEQLNAPTPSTKLSQNNESHAVQQTIAWKNKLVVILSQSKQNPLTPDSSNEYDVLRRLTAATHGDLLTVYKTEITNLFNDLFPYFYEMQNTLVNYNAGQNLVLNVESDQDTQVTYVLITVELGGTMPSLTTNQEASPEAKSDFYALYRVYKSASPEISVHGSENYNIRLWINSLDTAIVSYSDNVDVDAGHLYTFSGFQQLASIYTSIKSVQTVSFQTIIAASRVLQDNVMANLRTDSDTCSFAYQTPVLSACTEGPFDQKVTIKDNSGRTISRVIPGYCVSTKAVNATGWSCLNGGTRTGSAACACTINFNGLHCERPACVNGGFPDLYPNGNGHGQCICPYGFQGDFCEKLICTDASPDTFVSRRRSFAIVVQTSLSSANDLSKLYDSINLLFKGGDNNQDFDDYLLTTFYYRKIGNDTVPKIITSKFANSSGLIDALRPDNLNFVYSPVGPQPGLEALSITLLQIDNDKSSVFFFTDSDAAANDNLYQQVVSLATQRQIEISIVQVKPFGLLEKCTKTNYFHLSRNVGGNILNFCQPYTTQGDPLTNFIASYGSTHHHTEVIAFQPYPDISLLSNITFVVTDPTAAIYVVVNSPTVENFTVTATNLATGKVTPLVADAHSVPFFAAFQVNTDISSTQYTIQVLGIAAGVATVKVTEKSQLSVYVGFSPDPTTDKLSSTLLYGTPSALVLHLTSSLQSVPMVTLATYNDNGDVVYRDIGQKRTGGCKYEYFFANEIICDNAYETFTVTATVATPEVTLQRTQRAYCFMSQNTCLNGGISLNGQCNCINGYKGTFCEFAPCQNGGKIFNFKCICPANFEGYLCQYRQCNNFNNMAVHDPRQQNFQQITFLLEVDNLNMLVGAVRLQMMIADIVDQSEDVNFPKQFSLVVFNAQGSSVKVSTSHADIFVNTVKMLNLQNFTSIPTAVNANDALLKSFRTTIELPGIIHLLTSANPTNTQLLDAVRQRFGIQVNVYHFGSLRNPAVAEVNHYQAAIARQSGGRILPVTPSNFGSMTQAISNTVNENQLLVDDGAKDCTTAQVFTFSVESVATQLSFVATGQGVSITISDNNGVAQSNTIFSDDSVKIVTLSNLTNPGGQWSATLKTTASECFIQVRASTPLHVIPGFTNDENDDFPASIPRVGGGTNASSYITFRIMDSFSPSNQNYLSTVDRVEAYSIDLVAPYTHAMLLNNITVNARSPTSCASQYVTELVKWTETYEKFIVYGSDFVGKTYQRTFFFSKNSAQPCKYGDLDSFGFCTCDGNHQGHSCNMNICQNGGTSSYGVCDCPDGYYGDFCEKLYRP